MPAEWWFCYKYDSTRSKALSEIVAQIVLSCKDRNISILASHLPGNSNIITEEKSRTSLDSSDWMLLSDEFQKVSDVWQVDPNLFASAWNAQFSQFLSWLPQPRDFAVYVFPPFALIPRCLAKIKRDKADFVLICPLWRSWFPPFCKHLHTFHECFIHILFLFILIYQSHIPCCSRGISSWASGSYQERFECRGFSPGVVELLMGSPS